MEEFPDWQSMAMVVLESYRYSQFGVILIKFVRLPVAACVGMMPRLTCCQITSENVMGLHGRTYQHGGLHSAYGVVRVVE